ncbi:hypothetical protein ACOSOMT5_P0043 [Acidiphilium sp. MT5]
MVDRAGARHLTEADRIVGALAFAAGSADAFAFHRFHDVFTSAMTGNTALLGIALGQGHLIAASRSLAALGGFSAGATLGTFLADLGAKASGAARLRRLLVLEFFLLLLVALGWAIAPHPLFHAPLYGLILIGAMAMGLQSVAARTIDLPGIPTVVFTTTLTMIMMGITRAITQRVARSDGPTRAIPPITARQIGAMGLYVGGAAATALVGLLLPLLAAWTALLAVVIALRAARHFTG